MGIENEVCLFLLLDLFISFEMNKEDSAKYNEFNSILSEAS